MAFGPKEERTVYRDQPPSKKSPTMLAIVLIIVGVVVILNFIALAIGVPPGTWHGR